MKNKNKMSDGRREIIDGMRAVWRHIRVFKRRIIVLAVLGLFSAVANGFIPYITGRFLDALIGVSQGAVTFVSLSSVFSDVPLWAVLLGIWAVVQLVANVIDWVADRKVRIMSTEVHIGI